MNHMVWKPEMLGTFNKTPLNTISLLRNHSRSAQIEGTSDPTVKELGLQMLQVKKTQQGKQISVSCLAQPDIFWGDVENLQVMFIS